MFLTPLFMGIITLICRHNIGFSTSIEIPVLVGICSVIGSECHQLLHFYLVYEHEMGEVSVI